MNKLMDWIKGKFMKYHISDKEYDMIHKDMQEENRNSLLFFSVITILFLFVMLLISFCSPLLTQCQEGDPICMTTHHRSGGRMKWR